MRPWLLMAAALTWSCSDSTPPGGTCQTQEDCSAGEVCDGSACKALCATDQDCTGSQACVNSVCVASGVPSITLIDGDSAVLCPDGQGSHCVAAGLHVEGRNFNGATFTLQDGTSASPVDLVVRAGGTNTSVDLDLPFSVGVGAHILTVTNSSGSADQTFQFIQGPTGPSGANGSPDTAAEILAKLTTVLGPGSGLDADTLDGTQLSALQGQIDGLTAQLDAMAFGVSPVGTIQAWHKSLSGVASLPEGWEECNGQQITDTQSPLYLTFLPDLNGYQVAGRRLFLRGGGAGDASTPTASGALEDDAFQGHWHNHYDRYAGTLGSTPYWHVNNAAGNGYRNANGWFATREPISDGANGTPRTASETRPANMSVVWIVRVK